MTSSPISALPTEHLLEGQNLIAIVSVAASLGLVAALEDRSGDELRVDGREVLKTCGIATVIWAALMWACAPSTGFEFAGHAARYFFVVVPAVLIGRPVLGWRRGRGIGARVGCAVGLAAAGTGIYAVHVEPTWLRVDNVSVAVQAGGVESIRVGVLADLETDGVSDHEKDAVTAILAAEPDIILIPGDLFGGDDEMFARERTGLKSLLLRLSAPYGVFFVEGDSDRQDQIDWLLEGTNIVRLDNEIAHVRIGDQSLHIGGNRLDWETEAARAMRAELGTKPASDVVVLVAHRPDAASDLRPTDTIDLVVAGHTHGGQIVVPFLGPPVTATGVPRDIARGGLHVWNGHQIYVSTGVGAERAPAPRVRLFSRPSVGILDLWATR